MKIVGSPVQADRQLQISEALYPKLCDELDATILKLYQT
jgi:hypothetical protein